MKVVIDICKTCDKEFNKTGNNQLYCSKKCWNGSRRGIWNKWVLANPKSVILHGARSRAKRDGIPFNISEEDIEIPETCPVLHIPIKRNKGSGWHNDSPSLDRIDNNLGYTKGNVRVISNRANRIKCDATFEELELVYLDARSGRYRNRWIKSEAHLGYSL